MNKKNIIIPILTIILLMPIVLGINFTTKVIFGDQYYLDMLESSDGRLMFVCVDNADDSTALIICDASGENCYNKTALYSGYEPAFTETTNGRLIVGMEDWDNNDYGTFAICNSTGDDCSNPIFYNNDAFSHRVIEASDGRLIDAFIDDSGTPELLKLAICNSTGENCVNKTIWNTTYNNFPAFTQANDNRLVIAFYDGYDSNKGSFFFCNSNGDDCVRKIYYNTSVNVNQDFNIQELSDGRWATAFFENINRYLYLAICDNNGNNCVIKVIDNSSINNMANQDFIELSDNRLAVAYSTGVTGENSVGNLSICNSTGENCSRYVFRPTETGNQQNHTEDVSIIELTIGTNARKIAISYRVASSPDIAKVTISNIAVAEEQPEEPTGYIPDISGDPEDLPKATIDTIIKIILGITSFIVVGVILFIVIWVLEKIGKKMGKL